MKIDSLSRRVSGALWARLILVVWVGLLMLWAHQSKRGSLDLSVMEILSRAALLASTRALVLGTLAGFAPYVPIGLLVALSLPSGQARVERPARKWLPGVVVSLLLATLVLWFKPGPFWMIELPLPWTACLIGCWAGMAWTRGRAARLRFLRQFALIIAALAGGLGILLYLAVEAAPLPLPASAVTSEEKRRLYSLFAGKNPMKLEQGRTVELRFTAQDLNSVLAWGCSLVSLARGVQVQLLGSQAELRASAAVPGRSYYLNLTLQGGMHLGEGHLELRADRMRVGRVEIPRALLRALSPVIARAVAEDARVKPILQLLHSIDLQSGILTITYGHGDPPKGFLARLFRDPEAVQIDIPAIQSQILSLVAGSGTMPSNGDARFGAALQAAFRFARHRSTPARAIQENRSAILALGVVLGHHRVQSLIGTVMEEATGDAAKRAFDGTTLRARTDWTKHFFVSAALAIVAAGNVSDATGLFKEEKDAGGGSGFSFGDLLADRAGTTFAEVATRSESAARALQERLERGFNVDEYFPEARDLPENLQDAELQARFGGVGGAEYRRLIAEMERRISACAAYRESP